MFFDVKNRTASCQVHKSGNPGALLLPDSVRLDSFSFKMEGIKKAGRVSSGFSSAALMVLTMQSYGKESEQQGK